MRQGPRAWLLGVIRLVTTGREALAPRGRGHHPPKAEMGAQPHAVLPRGTSLASNHQEAWRQDAPGSSVQGARGEGAQTGSSGSPPQSSGGAFDWHAWAMGTSVSECIMLLQNVEE